MTVRQGNIRTKPEMGGGTLYDIGVYCINAARAIFPVRAEERHGDLREQRGCENEAYR